MHVAQAHPNTRKCEGCEASGQGSPKTRRLESHKHQAANKCGQRTPQAASGCGWSCKCCTLTTVRISTAVPLVTLHIAGGLARPPRSRCTEPIQARGRGSAPVLRVLFMSLFCSLFVREGSAAHIALLVGIADKTGSWPISLQASCCLHGVPPTSCVGSSWSGFQQAAALYPSHFGDESSSGCELVTVVFVGVTRRIAVG